MEVSSIFVRMLLIRMKNFLLQDQQLRWGEEQKILHSVFSLRWNAGCLRNNARHIFVGSRMSRVQQ